MRPTSDRQLLQIRDLCVDFDADKPSAHRAVESVSLSIAEGEVLGLVGESGSGKTVLSYSILGLLPSTGRITSGSVVWLAQELRGLPESKLRLIRGREIAMIFQDPQASLNPVYTVGTQIGWVLDLHRGMRGAEAKTEVLRLLDSVKLRDPSRCARSYPHELSGGMCQRAMIAMALAGRPKLLIADEPTSALDVSVAAEIVSLLAGLREEFALSVMVITHDLSVATCLADRIAVLDRGRLVECVPADKFIPAAQDAASRSLIDASLYLGAAFRSSASALEPSLPSKTGEVRIQEQQP
jgi:ABC-type dipeptide/oligopeptide/nickel transport system ATPase component